MKTFAQIETEELRTLVSAPMRNTILLRLPEDELRALQPHVEFVRFDLGTSLISENEPIEFVYFINSGLVSLIVETQDGRSVEVGACGREDLVGLSAVTGLARLNYHAVVQVSGDGYKVEVAALKCVLENTPELRRILALRLAIRSIQLAQNTACNRLHNIRQRLARWLLATYDRIDSVVIVTTHDFLARMVGSDRPSVSVALGLLQREGAISGSRGSISIVDRGLLRQQSCECYDVFEQFNQELGLT